MSVKSVSFVLNKALKMNGVEQTIVLKPLTFNIMETSDTSQNTSIGSEDTTNNDTEKATENNENKNLDE